MERDGLRRSIGHITVPFRGVAAVVWVRCLQSVCLQVRGPQPFGFGSVYIRFVQFTVILTARTFTANGCV
jgi:hypothetical protein